jgi:hypothetical protein
MWTSKSRPWMPILAKEKMKGQNAWDNDICWNLGRSPAVPPMLCTHLQQPYFLGPRFCYLLFPNLTHKTKIETAKGQRLIIAAHLDRSNCSVNWEQVLGFALLCLLPTSISITLLSLLTGTSNSRRVWTSIVHLSYPTWAALALMCQIP